MDAPQPLPSISILQENSPPFRPLVRNLNCSPERATVSTRDSRRSSAPCLTASRAKCLSNAARFRTHVTGSLLWRVNGLPLGGYSIAPLISFSISRDGILGANLLNAIIPTWPEQWEGSPTWLCSSNIDTERPCRTAESAALAPLTPHPTIAKSIDFVDKARFHGRPDAPFFTRE